MSWNDLYWNSLHDTDLRTAPDAGSTGSRRSSEITGYQHFFERGQQAAEQPPRHSDIFRVCYCFGLTEVTTDTTDTADRN